MTTKHVPLKEKLTKSLTHIKNLLDKIEAKIEYERTLLSQVNDNMIIPGGPPVGRMNKDKVTDIRRQSSNQTITESPFIQDLKKTMEMDKHNHFTAFLTGFMKVIAIKDPAETLPVLHLLSESVTDKLNHGIFDTDERLIVPTKYVLSKLNTETSELKKQAALALLKLKNKDTMISVEYATAIDFYASLFTKEEDGKLLFQALESFSEFPDISGQKTARQVSDMMLHAMLGPYTRIKAQPNADKTAMLPAHEIGTQETPFIQDLKKTMAADKHNYFTAFLIRFLELIAIKDTAETMPVIHLLSESVTNKLNGGIFDHEFGERFKGPLKVITAMLHHINSAELKKKASTACVMLKNKDTMLFVDYASMIDSYAGLFTKEDGELLFQALEGFSRFPKGQETPRQVSDMMIDAVFRPYMRLKVLPATVHRRRSMNLEQSNKHILLKHPKLLVTLGSNKNNRESSDEHLTKPEHTRRRAYVPSEDDYNHFEYFRDSVDNDKLHKIREDTSYSDDADQLRKNVYDALRYENRTLEASRKSGGDVNNKQAVRSLSTETDNEFVIKNNIYKVFEQEEERFL